MLKLNKAVLSLMIAAALAILAVVPAMAQDDEDIVIDFYWASAVEGNLPEVFEGYAQQFEEMNPGVDINPIYTGSYTQTRDTILSEADAPLVDVAIMLATDLHTFIEDSDIIPLNNFVDAEGEDWYNDFFPAFWGNSLEADLVWSVPFQRSTPILFYNADLLAEEGIDVPTNIEELIATSQALTTEDRAGLLLPLPGFPIWMYQSFAAAYGQPLVEDTATEVFFNSEASLQAVTTMTQFGMAVEDGGFGVGPMGGSAWGETPTAFTAGQAAMIYHTTGSITSILENADFEVGVSFLPSGPAGDDGTGFAAPTGGGNLYIFDDGSKTEAELQAAWDWVAFLASADIQSDWGAQTGYIAAREGAWEVAPLAELADEAPQYAIARDQLEFAYKEFAAFRSVDIQNIINFTLNQIISGEIALEDAQAALDDAQAQIDELLAEYR